MTKQIDSDAAAPLRRRLRFRSWHRGTREADLLLGGFADAVLDRLDADQLARYGDLLENNDPDLWDWVTERVPVPADSDSDVMRLLIDYARSRGRA
ncbi:succinate dehydrogenase assembly factor 2 [Inquilinus sp. Marseille-Q2685]|uniref:FAD assembly factor SdhE n=1 Tax=Inquilinus sp. Marseille-Q2685 TaxID=2866581 RepID=UPI001CE4A438|nr:succinate dehydrogenase assembly factor 2 [Inquilinus sp. Marseille-Q2685]